MKTLSLFLALILSSAVIFAQSNPNYKPTQTTTDAQNTVVQPQNQNPNPQREIIVPRTEPNIPPPDIQIPAPQQNNASYQDNSKFYNKDNAPSTETNKLPSSNGDYSQPGYSNPANKPSTQ